MRDVRVISLGATVAVVLLAGCGETRSSAEIAEYTKFCGRVTEIDKAAQETHSENPAAITDPTIIKDLRLTMLSLVEALLDSSPDAIKDDVNLMVSALTKEDKIFAANNYDLIKMAKNEDIRKELDAVRNDADLAAARDRYSTFIQKNCAD